MFMWKCYEFIFYIFHNLPVNVCISGDTSPYRDINQELLFLFIFYIQTLWSIDFRLCNPFQKIRVFPGSKKVFGGG